MKWNYDAGNSDIWLFSGVAVKEGNNFIAKNIVGRKSNNSMGDDDGNTIIFKNVSIDHSYNELIMEGSIKYFAQIFNFEGELEQITINTLDSSVIKKNNVKVGTKKIKKKYPKNTLFFIKTELEAIPLHFRFYVQQNRAFLAEIKKYEDILRTLNLSKFLFEWTDECKSHISDFEKDIQRVLDEEYHIETFFDEKTFLAQCLEDVLDRVPKEAFFYIHSLTDAEQQQVSSVDEYFSNIYEKLRASGYKVYDAWIDATIK